MNGLPTMVFGSTPNDDGELILNAPERNRLLSAHPGAETLTRRFVGAKELLEGNERWVLWIHDRDVERALSIPPIAERLDRVARYRRRSTRNATVRLASTPHRLGEMRHRDTSAIVVPRHTSGRREYIPLDFVGPETVVSSAANAVYNAEPWLFALLHSRMHMTWVRAVAGRIKTDIRYSAGLVYNTFPVPEISDYQRATLTSAAVNVLTAREQFSGQTLAELYHPDKMPPVLRSAHRDLDNAVDALYEWTSFDSDAARLELLFEMYEAAPARSP